MLFVKTMVKYNLNFNYINLHLTHKGFFGNIIKFGYVLLVSKMAIKINLPNFHLTVMGINFIN